MFLVFPRLRLRLSVLALPAAALMLWCEGALPFAVMLISAAGHELGHLLAMAVLRRYPRRIDLLPMGALIVCPEGIPDREELVIALSGPAASLCLASAAALWFAFFGTVTAFYAFSVNLVLGIFNLMPVRKLDGGKALRCFLNGRSEVKKEAAERLCSAASAISKLLFLCFAFVCATLTGCNLGVILLTAVLAVQLLAD